VVKDFDFTPFQRFYTIPHDSSVNEW